MQDLIRPSILRRKKEDVDLSIRPKEETVIEVELTQIQRTLYRSILDDNRDKFLKCINPDLVNFSNIMMEIRKVCNHPYLLPDFETVCLSHYRTIKHLPEKEKPDREEEYGALILASGKTILIDKLLPKLKRDGHKVLIFSQMTQLLDILEDFLGYRGYKYEGLDGSCDVRRRQEAIARFADREDSFVFLLSTRWAGSGSI